MRHFILQLGAEEQEEISEITSHYASPPHTLQLLVATQDFTVLVHVYISTIYRLTVSPSPPRFHEDLYDVKLRRLYSDMLI